MVFHSRCAIVPPAWLSGLRRKLSVRRSCSGCRQGTRRGGVFFDIREHFKKQRGFAFPCAAELFQGCVQFPGVFRGEIAEPEGFGDVAGAEAVGASYVEIPVL